MQTAYIVKLSDHFFQGSALVIESEAASLDFAEQERLVSTRMREKLRMGLQALDLNILAEAANSLMVHLHSPLQLGVVNWACSHRHISTDAE